MKFIATIASLLLIATTVKASDLTSCGDFSDLMNFESVSLGDIVLGEDVCFSVRGDLKEAITGGSITFIASALTLELYRKTHDICGNDKGCSFEAGPQEISMCVNVPDYGVGAGMTVHVRGEAVDQANRRIFCLEGNVEIQAHH